MTHNAVTQEEQVFPWCPTLGVGGEHSDLLVFSRPQPFQPQELPYPCSPLSWGVLRMGLVVPTSLTVYLRSPSL